MPKTIFMEAEWDGDIVLGEEVMKEISKRNAKKIALFASVQFLKLDNVIKKLEENNIDILTTKAKRANKEIQVLGCDAYHDAFNKDIISESDVIIYIGDGLFHPKAVLLSQRGNKEKKDIIVWDPVADRMTILTFDMVKKQVLKTKANLKRFISAKKAGILVTVKPGQEFLGEALKLKKHLESQGKEAHIFIDDTIQIDQFENYPFIDVWINTGCPRIGLDDHMHCSKPLINSREAYDPIEALESLDNE
ncbi:MAG: diphthamide synthesis protein [Nanoarchaeota archaeon]